MPVSDYVIEFAVKIVRMTRLTDDACEITKKWLNWGAGPRASSILISAAKANALINGRFTPEINDVNLINAIAQKKLPVIASLGCAEKKDIDQPKYS